MPRPRLVPLPGYKELPVEEMRRRAGWFLDTMRARRTVRDFSGIVHHAGLVSLTHTPSPMRFLNDVLGRPEHERPFLILVTGFPDAQARVPDITKKGIDEIALFVE